MIHSGSVSGLLHSLYTLWALHSHTLYWPCWTLWEKYLIQAAEEELHAVTDWTLRSHLIINPESIFSQPSPLLFLFPRLTPSHCPERSRRFLRCDITLPGNSLFLIPFSSLLWNEGVDHTIWPTHNTVWWLFCVWVDVHWTWLHHRAVTDRENDNHSFYLTVSWDKTSPCYSEYHI